MGGRAYDPSPTIHKSLFESIFPRHCAHKKVFLQWDVPLPKPHPTLVGINEIAERLGVKRNAVDQWRHYKVMPPAPWLISGHPVWDWEEDIVPWAIRTGRMEP